MKSVSSLRLLKSHMVVVLNQGQFCTPYPQTSGCVGVFLVPNGLRPGMLIHPTIQQCTGRSPIQNKGLLAPNVQRT